jgi:hypothetical protein
MTTFVIGGIMMAGLMYFSGRGKHVSATEAERAYKVQHMEEELQRMKDKTLYQL